MAPNMGDPNMPPPTMAPNMGDPNMPPPTMAPGTMPPPVDISDGLPPADPCMAVPAGPDRDACYATAPVPGMAPPAP